MNRMQYTNYFINANEKTCYDVTIYILFVSTTFLLSFTLSLPQPSFWKQQINLQLYLSERKV
jgi:hypothetical protein